MKFSKSRELILFELIKVYHSGHFPVSDSYITAFYGEHDCDIIKHVATI